MTNESTKTDEEAILLVSDDIAEVKALLRQASQQLLRIERQLKAALPQRIPVPKKPRQRIDEQGAGEVINRLKERLLRGEQIEGQLRVFTVKPELQRIARLLGMTNTKLPPKDELIRRISTRLRQGVSVTSGISETVTQNHDSGNRSANRDKGAEQIMKSVCERLDKLGIAYSILRSGELFFRRDDGVPMYVLAYPNNQYDWTFKGSHNDTNHLVEQFRKASE
jgi:hypothetical protein